MADSRDHAAPQTIYLHDYKSPDFYIETVELNFVLDPECTDVKSRMTLRRNTNPKVAGKPLILDGEELELLQVSLDGSLLASHEYVVDDSQLVIHEVPDSFVLEIHNLIYPASNTSLEGLYVSSSNFSTQCEAQGFRKITYYLDRPDVMARFTTTISAVQQAFPVLLSNGNPIDQGVENDRHWVRWEDPFPKPSYLFALVAGDLGHIEGQFVTALGRQVALAVYVQHHNLDKCDHAMASLKKSMAWDEQVYGREYDLDRYMIVAVDDFNMGAMENKGLNIFNSKCVLARPDTATDADYQSIEGVIGHEYFHNWSGNRVTCRDWFQLSLKEGFTVFRDQEFSADQGSRGVKRIQDVNVLRTHQFREDSGPMAHPVRPESYLEINNFYTLTVYNKGAEVVRMLHNLLGEQGFRRGTDLYFERHDGQAVTTDDFVRALEAANDRDFSQFRRWYSQAGTPVVTAQGKYNAGERTYTLVLSQSCPATPEQGKKQAFHIPFAVGLLDKNGAPVLLQLKNSPAEESDTIVLELKENRQEFEFQNIPAEPVISLLRGFSAPVKLEVERDADELAFLMAHDSDAFSRWDASQQLYQQQLLQLVKDVQSEQPLSLDDRMVDAFAAVLARPDKDMEFTAELLRLPSESYLGESMNPVDPDAIHAARRFMQSELLSRLQAEFLDRYQSLTYTGPYDLSSSSIGRRSLRNLCLAYLMSSDSSDARALCYSQFTQANNMTDSIAALARLANSEGPEREQALADFYAKWQQEPLVVDKWFSVQAISERGDTLDMVHRLLKHPAFTLKNPNRLRSLLGSFCQGNLVHFHQVSGSGYALLGDQVLAVDSLNPQVAARLVRTFSQLKRFDVGRQELMRKQLERIINAPGTSKDVYEIASKSLN